jgi:hypothetical protein
VTDHRANHELNGMYIPNQHHQKQCANGCHHHVFGALIPGYTQDFCKIEGFVDNTVCLIFSHDEA